VAFKLLARQFKSDDAEEETRERRSLYFRAEEYLWRAAEADPLSGDVFFNLAYVQFLLGKHKLALANNLKAKAIQPRFAAAKCNIAACYLELGNRKKAVAAIKSIGKDDRDVQEIVKAALEDEDLAELLEGSEGASTRDHLKSLLSP
jgi:tetratricopeptide (TPR) repeat protein